MNGLWQSRLAETSLHQAAHKCTYTAEIAQPAQVKDKIVAVNAAH